MSFFQKEYKSFIFIVTTLPIFALFCFFYIDERIVYYMIPNYFYIHIRANEPLFLKVVDILGKTIIGLITSITFLIIMSILKFKHTSIKFMLHRFSQKIIYKIWHYSILIYLSIQMSCFVTLFLKWCIGRARPYTLLNDIPINTLQPFGHLEITSQTLKNFASFPSGHATNSFAIATAIYLINKKAGIVCYIIATTVALQRLISLSHYPSDLFAGAFIGCSLTYLIYYIYNKYSFLQK